MKFFMWLLENDREDFLAFVAGVAYGLMFLLVLVWFLVKEGSL